MTGPKRIQRKRTKGWRMPEGAIYVGQPTKWGNPFRVMRNGGFMWVEPGGRHFVCSTDREGNRRERIAESVALYRERWVTLIAPAELEQLRGHDLACWCPLDQPCHADVLLDIANA